MSQLSNFLISSDFALACVVSLRYDNEEELFNLTHRILHTQSPPHPRANQEQQEKGNLIYLSHVLGSKFRSARCSHEHTDNALGTGIRCTITLCRSSASCFILFRPASLISALQAEPFRKPCGSARYERMNGGKSKTKSLISAHILHCYSVS